MRRAAASVLLALAAASCGNPPEPPPAPPAAVPVAPDTLTAPPAIAARLDSAGIAYRVLDREGDAYALVRADLGAWKALVQWADLRRVVVEQTLGTRADSSDAPGRYHPTVPSPVFALVATETVVAQARRDGAYAVLNGAFFETPGRPASRLAFPLALGGRVVTGGSSPYGPGRRGAETARWGRPLRALGLADTLVHVSPYDPATGAPLGDPAFAEAIVSYAPDAHPTRIATRFHVLGALDADGNGTTETLVIVTSDGRTDVDAPAALLARFGVARDHQTTLDGGASVLLWNRRAGRLERPAGDQPLPHLLTLRRR